jgi:hypothetical protein
MLASVGVIGVPTVPSTAVGGGVSAEFAETDAVNGARLSILLLAFRRV